VRRASIAQCAESPVDVSSWSTHQNASTLAGVVAVEAVVARSPRTAVIARRIDAYPNGWEFEVVWVSTEPGSSTEPDRAAGVHDPASMVELGIHYPDGRSATSGRPSGPPEADELVLVPKAGGGFLASGMIRYWISPLPPAEGVVRVVASSAPLGVPQGEVRIPAVSITAAAERAQRLLRD